ncbi:tetratricopeptide repeat protein [Aquabacterium olei]|nr:hypothetical protein [Aquabacterium olei]
MIGIATEERARERPFLLSGYVGLWVGLLAVALLLAYSDVVANGYVWDDWEIVARALGGHGRSGLETILGPVLPGAPYFRPLVIGTFVAEMQWGGSNSARTHTISIAIHLANTLLIFSVMLVLARRIRGSLNVKTVTWLGCGTLLYALHPALIEAVAWASARFDLLATNIALVYVLAGLLLRGAARLPILFVLFLAAMFSKEAVIGLPIFFALLSDALERNARPAGFAVIRLRGLVEGVVICLLGAGIYFYAKSYFIDQAIFTDTFVANEWGGWRRFALIGETLLTYASLVFAPFTSIGPYHPIPWDYANGYRPLFVSTGVACFAGLMVVQGLRGRWWLLIAIMCVIAPVINVLPLSVAGSIAQDRYLTLPLAMIAISSVVLVLKTPSLLRLETPASIAVTLLAFAVFWMNVKVTVPLWKSDLTLWAWAAEKHGSLPYVRKNHVSSLIAYGMIDQAEAVLAQDVTVGVAVREVKMQEAMLRAQLHLKKGEWAKVIETLEPVETHTEKFWEVVRKTGGDPAQMWLPSDSPVANSDEIRIFLLRSEALLAIGRYKDALGEAEKAVFVNRRNAMARVMRAFAYYGQGKREVAEKEYQVAIAGMMPEQRQVADRARSDLLARLRD